METRCYLFLMKKNSYIILCITDSQFLTSVKFNFLMQIRAVIIQCLLTSVLIHGLSTLPMKSKGGTVHLRFTSNIESKKFLLFSSRATKCSVIMVESLFIPFPSVILWSEGTSVRYSCEKNPSNSPQKFYHFIDSRHRSSFMFMHTQASFKLQLDHWTVKKRWYENVSVKR